MIDNKPVFSATSQASIPGKTNMHSFRLIPAGIAIVAVLVTQSAFATPHQLVITETPGNSLTVTYDGSAGAVAVVPIGPDAWKLVFPSSVLFPSNVYTWIEPESSAEMNELRRFQGGYSSLQVLSDVAASGHPAANGATVSFGTDGGVPISVTFYDDANIVNNPSTIPETGSTLALLCLSSIAVFAGTRFWSTQRA